MAKYSHSLQKYMIFKVLNCFSLLMFSATANFFNFGLSTTNQLDPTTEGFTIKGSATNNYVGISVSTAGDIDGDGFDDYLIGAHGYSSSKGRVYVIYGRETSSLDNIDLTTALDPHTTGFMITGAPISYLGYSVSTAGDVNKDGHADIIIGAHAKDTITGAAYVIYGGPKMSMQNIDFSAGDTLNPSTTGFVISGDNINNQVGYSVSTAGDVNQDGYADIIVGAPGYNSKQGRAYVIYGGEKATRQNINLGSPLVPSSNGFTITGSTSFDQLGWSVSTAGDIDKDGYADIMVGANMYGGGKGSVYVIYGRDKSLLKSWDLGAGEVFSPSTTGFQVAGPPGNNQLGVAVSTAGDIDKDGFSDIIIGMSTTDLTGAAYVIYGRERSTMANWIFGPVVALDPSSTGFLLSGVAASDFFGATVSSAGDMNKDGYNDILIGAMGRSGKGAAYVIYGGPRASRQNIPLASVTLDPATNGFMITGISAGDQLGCSVAIAGDINKDGYKDIIIGARIRNGNKGEVYVIHTACAPCWNCEPNCNTCPTSSTVCTGCTNPYHLYQADCHSPCPDTTFADSTATCAVCPGDCKHCSDAATCTECVSPYYLFQSQCYLTCPETSFADSSTTCSDCLTSHCKHCSDATTCTECVSPYLLYQSQCYSPCPDSTFAGTATACEDCLSTNCKHCSDATTCTECISPFLLYQSECISTCPLSTVASPGKCEDCPKNCFYCTSTDSCKACSEGYVLVNSACVAFSVKEAQGKASRALASATQVIGGVVCVGSATFPVTALVSTIVQNTRYLNLTVTMELSEIYKTWNTDLISWDVPNLISDFDEFEESPPLFYRYELGSSFLNNFWPTLVNIAIGFATFVTSFVLKKLLIASDYNEGWAYSLVQKLLMGSFNFTFIQAYACMDNIMFYLVIDTKTNPFNSFFSWASMISAVAFLVLGSLLVFFNFWTVMKYQNVKRQNAKDLDAFNERNQYWELFYSDFNDEDLLSQSFFAFLIVRSTLSSFIVTVFYDYPLMQTSFLIMLDGVVIIFLITRNPFKTLRGTLCQYYFEIITLLVHICTFSLGMQDSMKSSSDLLRTILSTGIIYLNTALVTGSIGFMFIEIYKTISEKKRAHRIKQNEKHYENIAIQTASVETCDAQGFTPASSPDQPRKQQTWGFSLNEHVTTSPFENFHLFSGFGNNHTVMNDFHQEPSHIQDVSQNTENSFLNDRANQSREQDWRPVLVRHRPQPGSLRQKRRIVHSENKIYPANFVNNERSWS